MYRHLALPPSHGTSPDCDFCGNSSESPLFFVASKQAVLCEVCLGSAYFRLQRPSPALPEVHLPCVFCEEQPARQVGPYPACQPCITQSYDIAWANAESLAPGITLKLIFTEEDV